MPDSQIPKQSQIIVINTLTAKIMTNLSTSKAWSRISPSWPLKNIIACNPLKGFEDLNFKDALREGSKFFEKKNFPEKLETINEITIKWCQVFFDQGQSTIKMPNRSKGLFTSWRELAIFDDKLHQGRQTNIAEIKNLPKESDHAIGEILSVFALDKSAEEEFLILLLTTLSGWSSYVKYLGEWSYEKDAKIQSDYLAVRLIIASIIWPEAAKELGEWSRKNADEEACVRRIDEIVGNENEHRNALIKELLKNQYFSQKTKERSAAQLVFCIDVRSEPFRKSLESCGKYETYGFAGFFGIPTAITDNVTKESHASCPVLLSPQHNTINKSTCDAKDESRQIKGYGAISEIKKFYQALKYNFTTPLPLAEAMGMWSGGWMLTKTLSPKGKNFLHQKFQNILGQNRDYSPEIDSINFEDQCSYASGALRAIGLVDNFAKIVVFCGHGSQTENNTFATSLDCGACGGRHGDTNAKILAKILNQKKVRENLQENGIKIPDSTRFIAAKHNTTNDEVEIYLQGDEETQNIKQLKEDFLKAQKINNITRSKQMGFVGDSGKLEEFFFNRGNAWSETQPEWGLAKNASFIVGPRDLTKNIDLQGRSFLHSYDWKVDEDGGILNMVLNAPMVVAQWINSQYLFSTINNVAFGSGSKITQNVVGKIGVMQGNGSDLMHGLPLQSVYSSDEKEYHKPARLMSLVYAPVEKIDQVVESSPNLQQLFSNEWVTLCCMDPMSGKTYMLNKKLNWDLL
ncbi:MAG: hypothetical protein ACJA0S_000722 [Rickettsiales bacterium]|jgi:uncharacterized protein YbcC (UPF0753/DUF2309 family)